MDTEMLGEGPSRMEDTPDDEYLDDLDEDEEAPSAPRYPISRRQLVAVEVPAVIQDVDRAVKAFGRHKALSHVMEEDKQSLPLYLNPESPFCKPLVSHKADSHNVVLKVTVPKRTGRRRKKGSNGPWEGDIEVPDAGAEVQAQEQVYSRSRLDDPKLLKRKLADNVGKYDVEAVGVINHTHRYRGLADFYWDVEGRSDFARRYVSQVLPGTVDDLKKFKFTPGVDKRPGADILPPPTLTHMSLPFNYGYNQNPYVRFTEDGRTFNATAIKTVGYFIAADAPAPTGPQHPPDMSDSRVREALDALANAFKIRPIWTRRSLMNNLGGRLRSWNELKKYLSYTAYQFKGGPWRDVVCPYGVDPRVDDKYRIYQTLMFKLRPHSTTRRETPPPWYSLLEGQSGFVPNEDESHIFDGQTYYTDGKVWQVCDITDPLMRRLLENAIPRRTPDPFSGYYHGGLWGKVKAIMKTKLVAIRFQRVLADADFSAVLDTGDQTPTKSNTGAAGMTLPNLYLTREELTELRGKKPPRKTENSGFSIRVRDQLKDDDDVGGSMRESEVRNEPAQWLDEDDDEEDEDEEDEEEEDVGDDGRGADDMDEDDDDDDSDDDNDGYLAPSRIYDRVAMNQGQTFYPEVPR